ncbi:ABC transporter permease [Dactylosporangium sp. CA-092794]|uniref:ABC transporter permease n=1 Tax=Dactylosporangium sp. CA-092794 TaxID=3239929 RepID=UPI003D8DE11F
MPGSAKRRTPSPHWLLVVPALVLLAAILLLPLWQSFLRSVGSPDEWTAEHYRQLFTDGVTLKVLGRTALTALLVTVVALLLGYPYAYLMTRVGPRARGILLVVVLVPFWTSVMARNFAWIIILQRDGPVNSFFKLFGLDIVLYGSVAGVTVAMSQVLLPFMVLPLFSALSGIDRRLLLAARGLGSHPIVAFWKIYWPLSRSGVVAGLILVFTLSLGFYVTPALLGSPQESLIAQLLGQRTTQLLDFSGAGALGMVVLVVTLVLVAWANRLGGTISAIGVVATTRTKEQA